MTFELRPLVLLITTLLEYIEYNGHQNITEINFFVVTNDKYNMSHIYLIVDVSIIYFSFSSFPVEVRLFAYFFRRLSQNFLLTVSDNKGALALVFLYWIHSTLAVMSPSVKNRNIYHFADNNNANFWLPYSTVKYLTPLLTTVLTSTILYSIRVVRSYFQSDPYVYYYVPCCYCVVFYCIQCTS